MAAAYSAPYFVSRSNFSALPFFSLFAFMNSAKSAENPPNSPDGRSDIRDYSDIFPGLPFELPQAEPHATNDQQSYEHRGGRVYGDRGGENALQLIAFRQKLVGPPVANQCVDEDANGGTQPRRNQYLHHQNKWPPPASEFVR